MKKLASFAAFAVLAFSLSGCISVHTTETVVPPSRGTIVTTLPLGYRARNLKGVTYYYSGNVYYRAHPRGYVVVDKPW